VPSSPAVLLGLAVLAGTFAGCTSTTPLHTEVLTEILAAQERRDPAHGPVRRYLRHPADRVRAFAARAAGLTGDDAAFPALAELLAHDPSPAVRAHAALGLCELGRGMRELCEAVLADDEPVVRRTAALALARADAAAPWCDAVLALALGDADASVRAAAAAALAARAAASRRPPDPRMADTLLGALAIESDPAARLRIVAALGTLRAPAACPRLEDLIVDAVLARGDHDLLAAALRALADTLASAGSSAPPHPALAACLRRAVAGNDAPVAAAAAAALVASANPDPAGAAADQRALLDAIVAARAPAAMPALVTAALALVDDRVARDGLRSTLEGAAVAGDARVRAACLEGFARLAGTGALRALRHALTSPDPLVRAGAGRGLACLPALHGEVHQLALSALYDRQVRVAAETLLALARAGSSPLAGLAQGAPDLLAALADGLRPPLHGPIVARLFALALGDRGDPLVRALALRAARMLGDDEDDATRALLAAVADPAARGADAPAWPAPPPIDLRADFDWRWLRAPPRIECETTAGSFTIRLFPEAAPAHVVRLLQRARTQEGWPVEVVAADDERVQFGRLSVLRPPAPFVQRIEPGIVDPSEPGLVGFVPLPLPDLDAVDLFVARTPLDAGMRCTVVGRIVDGMATIAALRQGDRILTVRLTAGPD